MALRYFTAIASLAALFLAGLAVVTTTVLQPNQDAGREAKIMRLQQRVSSAERALKAYDAISTAQGELNSRLVANQIHLGRLVLAWAHGAPAPQITRSLAAVH